MQKRVCKQWSQLFLVLILVMGLRQASAQTLQFVHAVGNAPLVLFDSVYYNRFGEPFVVNKFKYYISGIELTDDKQSTTSLSDKYFLINEEDSASKIITLPIKHNLRKISFLIGVDSARNVSGVQTGSLDPMNAMFWTWNSGYVFAKLEGQSEVSPAPQHSFSWHVGGFRQKENALRRITLELPPDGNLDTLRIKADLLQWFDAVRPLNIAITPVCHQPGELATRLADNYARMFSVLQ